MRQSMLILQIYARSSPTSAAVSGLHQISKAGFGSINSAKGFSMLQAEASHAEVTPRRLHLVQQTVDCLRNIVPLGRFSSVHGAHKRALTIHRITYSGCPRVDACCFTFVSNSPAVAYLRPLYEFCLCLPASPRPCRTALAASTRSSRRLSPVERDGTAFGGRHTPSVHLIKLTVERSRLASGCIQTKIGDGRMSAGRAKAYQGTRHARPPGVPRAQEHPTHGATPLHRASPRFKNF